MTLPYTLDQMEDRLAAQVANGTGVLVCASAPPPPSEAEILDAVRRYNSAPTYVVKNSLNMDCSPRRWSTPQILRCLKKLELAGKVERAPSGYAVMLCWRLVH